MARIAFVVAMISAALGMDLEAYKTALAAGEPAPLMEMLRADGGRGPTEPHGESLLHMAIWHPMGENRPRMGRRPRLPGLRALVAGGRRAV